MRFYVGDAINEVPSAIVQKKPRGGQIIDGKKNKSIKIAIAINVGQRPEVAANGPTLSHKSTGSVIEPDSGLWKGIDKCVQTPVGVHVRERRSLSIDASETLIVGERATTIVHPQSDVFVTAVEDIEVSVPVDIPNRHGIRIIVSETLP